MIVEDEIKEGLDAISELSRNYRHVHVQLKHELGDNYDGKYPEYEKTSEQLMNYAKNAKKKLRSLKPSEKEIQKNRMH